MAFRDMKITEFIERLASQDPTPGGGTASAIAGAMGTALLVMTLEISIKEENPTILALREAYQEFLELADEDSKAFETFMEAKKLPRGTEEEKAKRKEALRQARKFATEVPLKTLERSLEAVQAYSGLVDQLSKYVLSDVITGLELLRAAGRGAYENVVINAKGKDYLDRHLKTAERLLSDLNKAIDEILERLA